MAPASAQPDAVCVWECGVAHPPAAAFESRWVSFGSSDGYHKVNAVVPPEADADTVPAPSCKAVWRSGTAAPNDTVAGIASVAWAPAEPGFSMFPALTLAAGSGSYAFFAKPC